MNEPKSLKMRNMSMGRLIASMSIPAMFSMLIQALYNIVDSIYVGRIDLNNDNMITAVGYAFPMQLVLMGFAIGIGIGTNVLVAQKLGEQKHDQASAYAKTGLAMGIVAGLIFLVASFFVVKPFMNMMSNSEEISQAGTSYLTIVMLFSMGMFIEMICNKILQGMGRMIIPMITQLIGAIINIILDPIFIFGWFGLPAMGIKGAAIATVIGQFTAMLFVVIYMFTKKFEIHFNFRNFRFKKAYVIPIVRVGAPSLIMNSFGSVTNVLFNAILKDLNPTETANAVLISYSRLQSFIFMPVFGLNQGGMPILSYNYGANNRPRYHLGMKILMVTAFLIMVVGLLIFQLFPRTLLNFFSPSADMLQMGIPALRTISISFVFVAFSIISSMALQSIGKGEAALIVSLLRQALVLLPCAYFLGQLGGIALVWWAFPIAEFIIASISLPTVFVLINKAFDKKLVFTTT
ncbi:MAG: MATE family efflux transporter [Bacilli bacterium]